MSQRGEQPPVRLAVTSGDGRIARRGNCLLFVPARAGDANDEVVAQLVDRFSSDGPTDDVRSIDLPRCIIEWGHLDEPIAIDTTAVLRRGRPLGSKQGTDRAIEFLPVGTYSLDPEIAAELWIFGGTATDSLPISGDLRDGDVSAGGFGLTIPEMTRGVAELEVTLAPLGPVEYPEEDTDRTSRRAGDVRCPNGHANASTNHICRVCGESLDSTAERPGPRSSSAVAGLRLPNGSVIPINGTIAIGRSPTAEAARLDDVPQLVAIEAPATVSRTHVVVRLDGRTVTVTDCEARGRTAVVRADETAPIALGPWKPCEVRTGDAIKLGGPTTLTITDPAELSVPPSLAATAPPHERDETT